MRSGEIWLVELDKRRPAVVLRAVSWLSEVHVVPITSAVRGLPSEVGVPNMPKASVANAQRLTLIPKERMIRRVGNVSAEILETLHHAVCAALDC